MFSSCVFGEVTSSCTLDEEASAVSFWEADFSFSSLEVGNFGIDFTIEIVLFRLLTWLSTSSWVADSFCKTVFACDKAVSNCNKLVFETLSLFTVLKISVSSLITSANCLFSTVFSFVTSSLFSFERSSVTLLISKWLFCVPASFSIVEAWTIEAFARKNVPTNADVTPNENFRIENLWTLFHIFSGLLFIVFSFTIFLYFLPWHIIQYNYQKKK